MMSEVPLYSLFMEVAGYVCRGVDSASLFLRSCQEAPRGAAMGRGVWGGSLSIGECIHWLGQGGPLVTP